MRKHTKNQLVVACGHVLSGVAALCLSGSLALVGAAQAAQSHIDVGGQSEVSRSLLLPLNKSAVIELPRDASDVMVAQPKCVDVVIRTARRVYFLGKDVCQTNAFFFDRDGRQILNLEVRVERDLDVLADVLKRVLPTARIQMEVMNNNIILRGRVENASDSSTARDIAGRFTGDPELVMNLLSIREPGQVMLKVRIVEMQRRLAKQLGINTNGTGVLDNSALSFAINNTFGLSGVASGGLSAAINTSGVGDITKLDYAFDAFEGIGLARTLAEPTLTSVSGESASFLAGGEFPVPTSSDRGVPSVEFKPFGVGLAFSPVVLSRGRISMKVVTEVSDVTQQNGVSVSGGTLTSAEGVDQNFGGYVIPGLTVRRAETTVELASGSSLAMAGLLQDNIDSVINGMPGLKDIPVLGQLFRSNEFLRDETELVIIATPYLVRPTDPKKLTDPIAGYVPSNDASFYLLGRLGATYGVRTDGVGQGSLKGPIGFILD